MIKNLLLKSLFVYSTIRYPKVPRHLRYFVRDNYYCRLRQLRFWRADYLTKKPYKEISFNGEFQQELTFVLPFAYWHFLNGTLRKTSSARGMSVFYFFSPLHEEVFHERIWQNNIGDYNFPNSTHSTNFDFSKWAKVPLKAQYQNDKFRYSKPLLVIANKYNIEWDGAPLNYFSLEMLDHMITLLKIKYQIVYNRPPAKQIVGDNSEILDLKEHDWIRKNHPEVLLMDQLFEQHKSEVVSFNHLQLQVYANCDRFISVHGGTAAMASYFGGRNIILSKRGIEHALKEFETIFPKLSDAQIHHAKNEEELFSFVSTY